MTSAIALAGRGLREMVRHPGLWIAIYLARLAVAAGFAVYAARILGPVLEGHPPPDLPGWILLVRVQPTLLVQLAIAAGGFVLLHFLAGTLVAGLVLRRLARAPDEARLRRLGELALLRLAALIGAVALLAGWGLLAYQLGELGLALDERLQVALQLALAVLVGLPLLVLLVTLQLAQSLVMRGRSAWRAARAGLALLHTRRAACALLSLAGWALSLLLAGTAIGAGLALEQAAAIGSAATQLWGYGWVTALGVSSLPRV